MKIGIKKALTRIPPKEKKITNGSTFFNLFIGNTLYEKKSISEIEKKHKPSQMLLIVSNSTKKLSPLLLCAIKVHSATTEDENNKTNIVRRVFIIIRIVKT